MVQPKGKSIQEEAAEKELAKLEARQIEEFSHLLNRIRSKESLWRQTRFKFLRDFYSFVNCNRDKYPPIIGDKSHGEKVTSLEEDGAKPIENLTKSFVTSLCNHSYENSASNTPVVQVVAKETKKLNPDNKRDSQRTKRTNLTLIDGDGNQVLGVLGSSVADCAKRVNVGDIIMLDLMNVVGYDEPKSDRKMPALLIMQYSWVGYDVPSESYADPIAMEKYTPEREVLEEEKRATEGRSRVDLALSPVCASDNRLCSKYGTSFKRCVCNTIPVNEIELEDVSEDCYFVTKIVAKMQHNEKRCLLYWWYATNVYQIVGKGNRVKLPDCLIHAIRSRFPSPDGKYKGYEERRYAKESGSISEKKRKKSG